MAFQKSLFPTTDPNLQPPHFKNSPKNGASPTLLTTCRVTVKWKELSRLQKTWLSSQKIRSWHYFHACRSTPLENGYTPAELLMGRKLRSTLPLAPEKLTPKLLATLIFAKTRFCSHINFIGRCLQSKVFPKGFRSNFHASSFPRRSNQYLYQIQCAQNSFSRNIMRITIRAMCLKRDDLDKQILQCRSELSKICPVVLLNSIRAKIQELNATLYDNLHQIKTLRLEHLFGELAVMQHLIAKTS